MFSHDIQVTYLKMQVVYLEDKSIKISWLACTGPPPISSVYSEVAPLASPVNDAGCWNWWGYLNDAHAMEYGEIS